MYSTRIQRGQTFSASDEITAFWVLLDELLLVMLTGLVQVHNSGHNRLKSLDNSLHPKGL